MIAYYGNHNTSLKVREQIVWSQGSKDSVWTEIVTEKIKKQKELLERLNKKESKMLAGFIDEIEYKDASNREGHAAKVYFNSLFGMKFTRTQENPFNAALNYGYSILLSAINRVITSNGYITQLGLFHDSMFNPFNLGSDLMEPFRPLVDETVFFMKPDEFNTEEKRVLQNILNQEVIIEDKRQLVSNAIKIYCKSIFEALTQNDISIIKFYTNEL